MPKLKGINMPDRDTLIQFYITECKKKCIIKTGTDMEDLNRLQSILLSERSQPKSPHTI